MKDHIETRVLELADYIIKHNATVRNAAKVFCVSKSTVHKDMRTRLQHIDTSKYDQVAEVLQFNLSERHIRGGIATKEKYQKLRIKKESLQ
ncbi:MAG: sporulation transcriptional regulator SpoIIID [Clostridia bacterium]|nr:sporulation transcriptional regulator SpoIIID [Clostridia bacterium]